MATIVPTFTDIPVNSKSGLAKLFTVTALTTTNTVCSGISYPNANKVTAQISGTFGAAGTFILEGSNDNSTFFTLTNLAGTALSSLTAAAGHEIREHPLFYRVRLASGGDGTTSVNCTFFMTSCSS